MDILNNQTKVLLPEWLMKMQMQQKESVFIEHVQNYLSRYPDYIFLYIQDGMAVCERPRRGKNG